MKKFISGIIIGVLSIFICYNWQLEYNKILFNCLLFITKYILCPLVVVICTTIIGLIVAKYKRIDEWLNNSHAVGWWSKLVTTHEDELNDIQENIMKDHRINPKELNSTKWKYHRGYILLYAIKTFFK